ncbi:MAG TPA: hypothetical protein VH184_21620 [Dongiaceae bacterium]|jgi:hypothetical protein|nr:hypothetical protein [Dongiaceae bacterium]
MTKVKGALEGPAAEPPAEPPEYLTQDEALAYIRAKGIPVAVNFFRDRRSKGKGPPTHYFGARALLRRDELDAWIPTIFAMRTWDRRARAKTMKAKAKAMKAKAKAKAEAAGTGEMRAE